MINISPGFPEVFVFLFALLIAFIVVSCPVPISDDARRLCSACLKKRMRKVCKCMKKEVSSSQSCPHQKKTPGVSRGGFFKKSERNAVKIRNKDLREPSAEREVLF